MAALHTDVSEVGRLAERAHVQELILTHYLPAEPDAINAAESAKRAGAGFSGTTTPGTTACGERCRVEDRPAATLNPSVGHLGVCQVGPVPAPRPGTRRRSAGFQRRPGLERSADSTLKRSVLR
jgi:hypothetical protein